jgi:hypothetical protein
MKGRNGSILAVQAVLKRHDNVLRDVRSVIEIRTFPQFRGEDLDRRGMLLALFERKRQKKK